MAPRVDRNVVSKAPTRVLRPGESLSRDDGSWVDIDYYFVQCPIGSPPLEFYYRDLSRVYGGLDGIGGREAYNQGK